MTMERWCKEESQYGVVVMLPNPSINAGVIQDGGKIVLNADSKCIPAIKKSDRLYITLPIHQLLKISLSS